MGEDTNSRITPEKQLLKLIEDSEGDHLDKAKEKYQARSFFSMDALKALWPFSGGGFSGGMAGARAFALDIGGINWILKICALASAAYVTMYIAMSMKELSNSSQTAGIDAIVSTGSANVREIQTGIKPQDFYIDKVDARNIFAPYSDKEEVVEEVVVVDDQPTVVTPSAAEFLSGLRLVGIAGTKEPDVIIENTKITKTFFLKKGGEFCGATVIDIRDGKVIIEYEDQELELR